MKKEVIAHKDPKSPISEIFRTLRTNIQFINTNKKTKTLLVTSTLPGEGKSWIASNLAVTFAQTGKKVVLIDADMRKGRQYSIFDIPPTPGLSNYLSEIGIPKKENVSEEIIACIRKTEVPNLYVMPAGSIPPNPSELLVSPKMLKLLEKCKQVFDITIIDGTPCELVTDAVILSRIVDSTIIVTAHKLTKKDALERVIKNIQNVGGNLTGVVVNKMPISGKRYEKQYYYYGDSSRKLEIEKVEPEIEMPKEEKKESTKKTKAQNSNKTRKTTKTKAKAETAKKEAKPKTKAETTKKEAKPKTAIETTTKDTKVSEKKEAEKVAKEERTSDILKQMNEYLNKEKGEEND